MASRRLILDFRVLSHLVVVCHGERTAAAYPLNELWGLCCLSTVDGRVSLMRSDQLGRRTF